MVHRSLKEPDGIPAGAQQQPHVHPTPLTRRRNPQEAAYNLGRAAHHLGLLHIAVPYYERVLESAPPPSAAAAGALLAGVGCWDVEWVLMQGRTDHPDAPPGAESFPTHALCPPFNSYRCHL